MSQTLEAMISRYRLVRCGVQMCDLWLSDDYHYCGRRCYWMQQELPHISEPINRLSTAKRADVPENNCTDYGHKARRGGLIAEFSIYDRFPPVIKVFWNISELPLDSVGVCRYLRRCSGVKFVTYRGTLAPSSHPSKSYGQILWAVAIASAIRARSGSNAVV